LFELSFYGTIFTWSNKQAADTHTRERLDNAYGNPELKDSGHHGTPYVKYQL